MLVFQQGHGSGLWDVEATESVTAWIPVMIFAFLFGLSMDYEVFMLTRMREAYDETGSTDKAIELGLARTGKLVTSAAVILMFAFLVLSTSPGYEIKPLAIGLAAGIILDATVIRALLVPAFMRLLGDANWWTPARSSACPASRPPGRAAGVRHPGLIAVAAPLGGISCREALRHARVVALAADLLLGLALRTGGVALRGRQFRLPEHLDGRPA